MGLFDKLRGEFVDIIEWIDNTNDTLIWRFPRYNNEIKMNAQLVCRESQKAVFINEGKVADIFEAGTHTLTTQNLPLLSTLKGWKYGFNSPFKAEVYFFNTKQFADQNWGTKNPITIEDARFGFIELRAFGNYSFRIIDPVKFIQEIVGTDGNFTTEEINGQLRTKINSNFGIIASKENIPIEKFLSNFEELHPLFMEQLNNTFDKYGLLLTDFILENVSMPDKLKDEIFEYSRLNKIDMQKMAQLKTAKSIEIAAGNEGIGGMGPGIGVGMGVGNIMGNIMRNMNEQITPNANSANIQNTPPPLQSSYFVAINGQQTGPFATQQLQEMIATGQLTPSTLLWKQGMNNWAAANSIQELSYLFAMMPPPLPPPII